MKDEKKIYGEYLWEQGDSVYTVIIYKSKNVTLETIKAAFTMKEK